jgi:hypothetical protein
MQPRFYYHTFYFLASDIDTVLSNVAEHHNKAVKNGTYDNKSEVA